MLEIVQLLNPPPPNSTHTGAGYVVVRVQIDERNGKNIDCDNNHISFVNSLTDEDKAPYLIIQSYDSLVDQIDYTTIFHEIEDIAINMTAVSATLCTCV